METTKIKNVVDVNLAGRKVQVLVDEIEYEQLKKDRLELQDKLFGIEFPLKKACFITSTLLEDDNLAKYQGIDTFDKITEKADEILSDKNIFFAVYTLLQHAQKMAMLLNLASDYIFECKKELEK